MRTNLRNMQTFWYANHSGLGLGYNNYGNINAEYAEYGNPIRASGIISPASGNTAIEPFGANLNYDHVIVVEERDTPIDENAVLWLDATPSVGADGSLSVDGDGNYVTPYNARVVRVARGLPKFGGATIAVSEVDAT